jgi:hypothetical protein
MRLTAPTRSGNPLPLSLLLAAVLWPALLLAGAPAHADDNPNDTCLACHGDKTMTTKRGTKTVSLFVDAKRFTPSVHGSLSCTNCHADLEGKDFPHSTPLAKVIAAPAMARRPSSTPNRCMAAPSPGETRWRLAAPAATAITMSCR